MASIIAYLRLYSSDVTRLEDENIFNIKKPDSQNEQPLNMQKDMKEKTKEEKQKKLKEDPFYPLVSFHYEFGRHHNQYRPDADAKCTRIAVTLNAPSLCKKDNVPSKYQALELWEWYKGRDNLYGMIVYSTDNEETYNTILFDSAICFSITDHYDNVKGLHRLKLEIASEKVEFCNQQFTF